MMLSISPTSSPLHLHPHPPISSFLLCSKTHRKALQRNKPFVCKAELVHDAPFAIALGACVLTSVVSPVKTGGEEEDGGGAMDSTDTRLAVMAIISILPYFNWLGWVFAWMDSGRQRYLIYSLVYLAPYLRTNFSLSPEESWLPIASILICILHVQLETSIKNGDLDGFRIPFSRKKESRVKRTIIKGHGKTEKKLPSSNESKDKLRDWGVYIDQSEEVEKNDENSNDDKFI
ncbi:hypothetical protein LUZ60_016447 [Juncus effusus]|nr:hypothetical protein LUZ60_016447 [Juncus effusus]